MPYLFVCVSFTTCSKSPLISNYLEINYEWMYDTTSLPKKVERDKKIVKENGRKQTLNLFTS